MRKSHKNTIWNTHRASYKSSEKAGVFLPRLCWNKIGTGITLVARYISSRGPAFEGLHQMNWSFLIQILRALYVFKRLVVSTEEGVGVTRSCVPLIGEKIIHEVMPRCWPTWLRWRKTMEPNQFCRAVLASFPGSWRPSNVRHQQCLLLLVRNGRIWRPRAKYIMQLRLLGP